MRSLGKTFATVSLVSLLAIASVMRCFAENFTTNIVDGVSSNAGPLLLVGDTGSLNYLEIKNGGSLTNQVGVIGNAASASSNSALVTGVNSLWMSSGTLTVGATGSFNRLTVSNSASVVTTNLFVSAGSGATSNVVFLNAGSLAASSVSVAASTNSSGIVWVTGGVLGVPSGSVTVGDAGYGQMTISNGTVQANRMTVGSRPVRAAC